MLNWHILDDLIKARDNDNGKWKRVKTDIHLFFASETYNDIFILDDIDIITLLNSIPHMQYNNITMNFKNERKITREVPLKKSNNVKTGTHHLIMRRIHDQNERQSV